MKRNMMMICIAVAALLLCAQNVEAQSRVVRKARTERPDERIIGNDDPRRQGRDREMRPDAHRKKVVDNDVIRAFEREAFDANRLKMADMIFSTGGLMSISQIIKVSRIFDFDTNRVKFLKKAYINCIDRHNYYKVLATLDYSSSRENVIRYVMDHRDDGRREAEPYYKVSGQDMNSIIKALRDEDFDSTRGKIARMIVCGSLLTTRQIADMAKTFDYDSNRLDFLLYAFDNCVDPQNYYIASNTLEYGSNRNNLMSRISRRN